MHDPGLVGHLQRLRDLGDDRHDLVGGQRSALPQQGAQRLPSTNCIAMYGVGAPSPRTGVPRRSRRSGRYPGGAATRPAGPRRAAGPGARGRRAAPERSILRATGRSSTRSHARLHRAGTAGAQDAVEGVAPVEELAGVVHILVRTQSVAARQSRPSAPPRLSAPGSRRRPGRRRRRSRSGRGPEPPSRPSARAAWRARCTIRPPVAANGWPAASEEPLTLSLARSIEPSGASRPSRSLQKIGSSQALSVASTCEANASWIS